VAEVHPTQRAIAPGREGLFALVRIAGNVALWVASDVVRFEDRLLEDRLLKEHWDVLPDEATKSESVSGFPYVWRPLPLVTIQGDKIPGLAA
jgi:hypothetical protein